MSEDIDKFVTDVGVLVGDFGRSLSTLADEFVNKRSVKYLNESPRTNQQSRPIQKQQSPQNTGDFSEESLFSVLPWKLLTPQGKKPMEIIGEKDAKEANVSDKYNVAFEFLKNNIEKHTFSGKKEWGWKHYYWLGDTAIFRRKMGA